MIDGKTGEILNGKIVTDKSINVKQIENDELFDGYFCIITSELHYTEKQIREAYGGLWEIGQAFRITKTNLEFRPTYHFKKENMQTHFLICFCSLLILRLLHYKLRNSGADLSPERIITVLNSMNAENFKGIIRLHKPPTNEALDIKFFSPPQAAFLKLENFRRYLSSVTFHTTSV